MRQIDFQTKELLPVFRAAKGFILMLHKNQTDALMEDSLKTGFLCFASTT